jgi:pyruvate/2-oxoglutarate dehydrogenase complex dihydrolipoamide acyltransferase (E2) component
LAGCGATSPLFFYWRELRHPAAARERRARQRWGAMGGLLSASGGFKFFLMMNGEQQAAIHQALLSVQSTVTGMTFPRCDQEDLIELIDRVEEQLHCSHPNTGLMCTFLNSIARSLRAQPEAREACLTIEQAIEAAGMPSTWQSGI